MFKRNNYQNRRFPGPMNQYQNQMYGEQPGMHPGMMQGGPAGMPGMMQGGPAGMPGMMQGGPAGMPGMMQGGPAGMPGGMPNEMYKEMPGGMQPEGSMYPQVHSDRLQFEIQENRRRINNLTRRIIRLENYLRIRDSSDYVNVDDDHKPNDFTM